MFIIHSVTTKKRMIRVLHTVGDSHASSKHGPWTFTLPGIQLSIHHLGPRLAHSFARDSDAMVNLAAMGVIPGDIVCFCFGEIDCRCHVSKYAATGTDADIREVVDTLVAGYMRAIHSVTSKVPGIRVMVLSITPTVPQHVPSPGFVFVGTEAQRRAATKAFNAALAVQTQIYGYDFVDIHDKVCGPDGNLVPSLSDGNCHLRDTTALVQALQAILYKDIAVPCPAPQDVTRVFYCGSDMSIAQQVYSEFDLLTCPTKRVEVALGHLVRGGDYATVLAWLRMQRFTFFYGEPWSSRECQTHVCASMGDAAIVLDASMDMDTIRMCLRARCRPRSNVSCAAAVLPCPNAVVIVTEGSPTWLSAQQWSEACCCTCLAAPPAPTVCVAVDSGHPAHAGSPHVHVALQAEPSAYMRPVDHNPRFARMYVHDSAVYPGTHGNVFGGVPLACSWIQPPYVWRGLEDKPEMVSCIASPKRMLAGHRLRHEVARACPEVHMFGPEYRPLPTVTHGKVAALAPYKYTIVIENAIESGFWTEKLVDAFICGCIVLFWGTKDALQRFDAGSLWTFETVEDLKVLLARCQDPDIYAATESARRANFHRAQAYVHVTTALCINTDLLSLVPHMPTSCACCQQCG